MSQVIYEIVEHDGGWAYKSNGVFSETFPNHEDASKAAKRAAREQTVPGEDTDIQFEDKNANWKTEYANGGDRPTTKVVG